MALNLTDHVLCSGWHSPQECAAKLQQADVMMFPSLHDCGGKAVLEAMAMGLPVIAANWGGPADYIDHLVNGILVEPSSKEDFIQGLTDNMLKLCEFPELRKNIGMAAKEHIKLYYDQNRQIDQLIEIYQQTIDNSKNDRQKNSANCTN